MSVTLVLQSELNKNGMFVYISNTPTLDKIDVQLEYMKERTILFKSNQTFIYISIPASLIISNYTGSIVTSSDEPAKDMFRYKIFNGTYYIKDPNTILHPIYIV